MGAKTAANILIILAFIAGNLALPPALLSAGGSKHNQKSGVMRDAGEYDWCHHDCGPFDRPTFFFCVQADDQILVGSRKADWVWQYDSSQMLAFRGKPISLRYDDRSIWIVRTDGKDMHLHRDYSQDVFTDPKCSAEVRRHWLKDLQGIKRPEGVPPEAVVVPEGPAGPWGRTAPHFWVECKFDSKGPWDVCMSWDEKGARLARLEGADSRNHRAVLQKYLVVDPIATKAHYAIHLTDGIILTDWAKSRINDKPSPDSKAPLPPKPDPDLP